MLLATLTFQAESRLDEPTIGLWVWPVLRGLWEGGQILRRDVAVAIRDKSAVACVELPERYSLSRRHMLPFTRAAIQELAQAGISNPKAAIVGRTADGVQACRCKRSPAYVMFTHAYSTAAPVRCGRCFGTVPLYRLPHWPEHVKHGGEGEPFVMAYTDILRWQRDFRRADRMWFDSGFGESFAHRQLSRPDSSLNQNGMSVRESLEDRTGRRTYYFQWDSCREGGEKDERRPCPSCGRRWRVRQEVAGMFGHKCERCRIVSM